MVTPDDIVSISISKDIIQNSEKWSINEEKKSIKKLLEWMPPTPILDQEMNYVKKIKKKEEKEGTKKIERQRKESKERLKKVWSRIKKIGFRLNKIPTSYDVLESIVKSDPIVDAKSIETYAKKSKRDLNLIERKQLVIDITNFRNWNKIQSIYSKKYNGLIEQKDKIKEMYPKKSGKFDIEMVDVLSKLDFIKKNLISAQKNIQDPYNNTYVNINKRNKYIKEIEKLTYSECKETQENFNNTPEELSEIIEQAVYQMCSSLTEYEKVIKEILNSVKFKKEKEQSFCELVMSAENSSIDLVKIIAEYFIKERQNKLKNELLNLTDIGYKREKRIQMENILKNSSIKLLSVLESLEITKESLSYVNEIENIEELDEKKKQLKENIDSTRITFNNLILEQIDAVYQIILNTSNEISK